MEDNLETPPWERIFAKINKPLPQGLHTELLQLTGIRGNHPDTTQLTCKLYPVLSKYFDGEEVVPVVKAVVRGIRRVQIFYIVEINRPRLFYDREDAMEEIESRKNEEVQSSKKVYDGGEFIWIVDGIYVYKFGNTLPAVSAKITDFIHLSVEKTDEILPPIHKFHVEIDLQIVLIPPKKMRLYKAVAEKCVKGALNEAVSQATALLRPVDDDPSESDVTVDPNVNDVTMYPNEDDVSKCVQQQVQEFASTHGLKMTVNKARADSNVGVTVLTKFVKSRPDTMILRIATLNSPPRQEEEEEEEEEAATVTVSGASTERKAKLNGDHVGQTLAGAEKVCGEVANQYLRVHGVAFAVIEVFSLLIDYSTEEAEVFKVSLNFLEQKSVAYRGERKLEVSEALNRVLDKLLH